MKTKIAVQDHRVHYHFKHHLQLPIKYVLSIGIIILASSTLKIYLSAKHAGLLAKGVSIFSILASGGQPAMVLGILSGVVLIASILAMIATAFARNKLLWLGAMWLSIDDGNFKFGKIISRCLEPSCRGQLSVVYDKTNVCGNKYIARCSQEPKLHHCTFEKSTMCGSQLRF